MEIETAALHYGAPVRVKMADHPELPQRKPMPKRLPPQCGALAWAAGIARAALGLEHDTNEELEIETR